MKSKLNLIYFTLFLVGGLSMSFDVHAGKTAANTSDSVVYNFKAGPQFWEVPAGVTMIHADVYGAQGGSAKGGKGGRVQSDMSVTPGAKLVIYVGSQPNTSEGGQNGGGKGCGKGTGGGGASDIRIGGTNLSNRVLVAGGGGGFGYSGNGGAGGGLTGGNGSYHDGSEMHTAKGGTQEAGGAGARAYYAKAGELGIGGEGINVTGQCTNGAMAGGGGGYYGGGGSGAGGGGGGSSYADAKINTNVMHEQGVNEGNGRVVISWVR